MKLWVKFLLITLVLGIPALILGPIIWTPSPDAKPTTQQLPFFIFLSFVEALLFGFGIAFIIYGWQWVKKVSSQSRNMTITAFISLAWLLVSWWPHDSLHIHNAMNMQGLLYIDYGFHLTLIIASLILVYYFFAVVKGAAKTKINKN